MQAILKKIMQETKTLEIKIFSEEMILNEPIENWPDDVFAAIAFHSTGFPINKVIQYVKKRNITVVNGSIENQKILFNRGYIKHLLNNHNVPQPQFIIIHRQRVYCQDCQTIQKQILSQNKGKLTSKTCSCEFVLKQEQDYPVLKQNCLTCQYKDPQTLIQTNDYIDYNGRKLNRPFIEKPMDADNHNVYIYTKTGIIKLFRKIENKASSFEEGQFQIRRDGCYVYEEFLDSGGKDMKIYSIYPNYMLAEIRKAPHVDGVVERDEITGKEKRQQIELSEIEREMARNVGLAFRQLICGLDILRTLDGKSLIMDVNGFSFVKGNLFYEDQCCQVIAKMIILDAYRRNYQYLGKDLFVISNKYLQPSYDVFNNKILTLSNRYIDKLSKDLSTDYYNKYISNNSIKQRGLMSVFRHADRAPKFKFRFITQDIDLLQLFVNKPEQGERLDFRMRPEFQYERSMQIAEDLEDYISLHKVNLSTIQISKIYQVISTPQNILDHEPKEIDSNKQINTLTLEGIKLMIYLIIQQLSGTKIQIKDLSQGTYQFTIKWGGYLTIAGLRQAFKAGKLARKKFVETKSNKDILLKIFHTSERRVFKSAQALILGFYSPDEVDIEQILPFLNQEPYTSSDFICPDIFSYLEKLHNNQNIPSLDYSIHHLRNLLQCEDQSLNIQSNSLKIRQKQYLKDINNFLLNDDFNNISGKHFRIRYYDIIREQFYPCIQEFKKNYGYNFTHKMIFEHITNLIQIVLSQLEQILASQKQYILFAATNHNTVYVKSDICMSSFIQYVVRQFATLQEDNKVLFNISKITDLYELFLFLLTHHGGLVKSIPEFQELFVLISSYYKPLIGVMYGCTQLYKVQIGEKITANLLRSIQDDMQMSFNYFRKQEIIQMQKMDQTQRQQEIVDESNVGSSMKSSHDQEFSDSNNVIQSDNNVLKFAQQLTKSSKKRLPPKSPSEHSSKLDEVQIIQKDKFQVRFYVTDQPHIYALYNLLSGTQMQELASFNIQTEQQLEAVNYCSQLHFLYSELQSSDYLQKISDDYDLSKSVDELINSENLQGPSRFVEIYYSRGQSQDSWQPVPFNSMPIDDPEMIFSLFPLTNMNKLSTKILKHSQFNADFTLESVVGIYRHGDRQPKQKIKINIYIPHYVDLIIKLFDLKPSQPKDISLSIDKHIESITYSIPLMNQFLLEHRQEFSQKDFQQLEILFQVAMTYPPAMKFQIKFPVPWKGIKKCTIILKYGGVLTQLGMSQSQVGAKILEDHIQEDLIDKPDELKVLLSNFNIFTNDEQRVQETAQQFSQHICSTFNIPELIPQEKQTLSYTDQRARKLMEMEKQLLNDALTLNIELCNTPLKDLPQTMKRLVGQLDGFKIEDLGNPLQKLTDIRDIMTEILDIYLEMKLQDNTNKYDVTIARYQAGLDQFSKQEDFNVSKIGDVYDTLRYEALQSGNLLPEPIYTRLRKAYEMSRTLAKFSIPLEYGTSGINRQVISGLIAHEMLKEIAEQLETPGIQLYFVSESLLHGICNSIRRYIGIVDRQWIDFMSHIIIKLYKSQSGQKRIEIYQSQGSFQNPFKDEQGVPRIQQPFLLGDNFKPDCFQEIYQQTLKAIQLAMERFDLGYDIIDHK
ncbi:Inositol-hexakisphosphate/diphosphoinositol-pentakisphosphate 1-kinase [Spironucleus salmonicida]|nr:Inositol-hexakisphosphate/diphosphoinositol-pentakisphosphate 1-kinase [Spironucleus salmonicida]